MGKSTTDMDTKCFGTVRCGGNDGARFCLVIDTSDLSAEEVSAMFGDYWSEEFPIKCEHWRGWCYYVCSRRDFAMVPAIIRKAEKIGRDVSTSMWDVGIKGQVSLSEDPAKFWKCLAMAQAFFKE
ncbi:MAG: hypothetical protein JW795_17095 [Chitinivibrionales bacterium]|nr:hypothetical protein [Chitinivibrionales bacterium]